MAIYEPYLYDGEVWPLMPNSDRWIMNKLEVAMALGYNTGPIGLRVNQQGTYCIRPILNFEGRGWGGVGQFEAEDTPRGITQPSYNPGRFWCEWFDGHHAWTEFIDDVAVRQVGGDELQNGFLEIDEEPTTITLPVAFQGISRYMLVESIGGNIIEMAPRHMNTIATQATIDDYLQFDPTYSPGFEIDPGMVDLQKIRHPLGFEWEAV